ncbi:MAG: hypothetical protein P8Y12_08625, partial [Gammaproteobacteria bacterium]
MKPYKPLPGASCTGKATDLPVMHPFKPGAAGQPCELLFSHWLSGFSPRSIFFVLLLIMLWPAATLAQGGYSTAQAFEALGRWLPFLVTKGFALNILISFMTLLMGTIAGVLLGLG